MSIFVVFYLIGIHYIGEMRNNTVSRLLVDQLTNGQLQWTDLVNDFDQVWRPILMKM